MSSENDIVLSVKNVSKCFEMYEKPVHRLYQTLCAGKSTLLQIITGTLAPTTGEVKLKGRVATLAKLGMLYVTDEAAEGEQVQDDGTEGYE